MKSFGHRLLRLIRDDAGVTSVEYALVLMLVLLAVIAGVGEFGGATNSWFEYSRDQLDTYLP